MIRSQLPFCHFPSLDTYRFSPTALHQAQKRVRFNLQLQTVTKASHYQHCRACVRPLSSRESHFRYNAQVSLYHARERVLRILHLAARIVAASPFSAATNGTSRRRGGCMRVAVPPTADRGEIFMRVKASTRGRELSRHGRN